MSNFSNESIEDDTDLYPDVIFSYVFRFWLFLISNILSIACCLFALYHLLIDRNLRQSLNNHIIIILLFICLIYELTDISFILNFYRFGTNWHITPSFSVFWSFLDYALYGAQFLLFSWATIERYILIFHDRWLLTKKRIYFLHYFPIIILIVYSLIYYTIIIILPFCPRMFFQLPMHGVYYPCIYYYVPIISIWELVCHQLIPVITIIIFSCLIFIRVLWQKSRLNRTIQWRKQRKMTIQLLSVSILFLSLSAPGVFLSIAYDFGLPKDIGIYYMPYAYFFSYYVVFLFPFVCLGSLPELRKKFEKLICYQRQQRLVHPQPLQRNPHPHK
jgi:hypothetical protein